MVFLSHIYAFLLSTKYCEDLIHTTNLNICTDFEVNYNNISTFKVLIKQEAKEGKMAEAIVSMVVGRLTDLLTEESQLLHGVRDEIQQMVTELMRMKTFLRDADSRSDEHRVNTLVAQVHDLVYHAEDVVETFLLKASSTERRKTQGGIRNRVKRSVCVLDDYVYHHKFSREIRHIQTRIQSLFNCFGEYDIRPTLEDGHESSSSDSSDAPAGKLKRFYSYSVVEPDLFVGFQEDVKSLVGHLVNENDDCYPVIFIGGMGGLGKTTLARKIYNHSTIKKHFSGLAWASISQKWQPKDVLQRILITLVHEKKEEIRRMEVDKLVENLLEVQQTKNCLIVLDDIWTNDAWDSLKAAFPTETSRSKLLLTSRNIHVADHVNPKCFIHKPKFLDEEQSWELLRLKALPKEAHLNSTARKKMEEWGREMVQNCGGLPLAIVVLGGILVTKPTMIEWEKVYYDSRSTLKRGEGLGEDHRREVQETLAWSYNVLPTQLKPCFVYLGKFEEDEEIEAERLYQLLIAEGMVLSSDKSGEESMMDVAESYMGELVHKSMVQVIFEDQVYPQRKFKSFVLHDLMRDLSLSIAKWENFFTAVDFRKLTNFSFNTASSTRQLVVYFDAQGPKTLKENPFFVDKAHQRRVRSVLMIRSLPQKSGLHLANFKFLRVFALEAGDFDEESVGSYLQKVLSSLVYLRYLSLEGRKLIFPSIQKLELLKTLNLDTKDGMYFPPWLPINILSKLGHLRHLYLPRQLIKGLGKNRKLRLNGLSKLETLENFDPEWCEAKDLPKLLRLEKLKLKVVGKCYDAEEIIKYLSSYSRPLYLTLEIFIIYGEQGFENGADMWRHLFGNRNLRLEKLYINSVLPELSQIFGRQEQQLGNTYIHDVSLIRITRLDLGGSKLEEDPMAVLEKIPTLRHLTLSIDAYMGKEMVCSAMSFPKLTSLVLNNLPNLVKWRVEEGSMPILNYLDIYDCHELEELPEGLRFLNSLDKLQLFYMPSDLCDRVRVVNGEKGPDFYKVGHVPRLHILQPKARRPGLGQEHHAQGGEIDAGAAAQGGMNGEEVVGEQEELVQVGIGDNGFLFAGDTPLNDID